MVAVLAIDVGNTAVKAGVVDGGVVLHRFVGLHERLADEWPAWWDTQRFDGPIGLVSVRPEATQRIVELLHRTSVWAAPGDLAAPIENACDPPQSVGQDRLFLGAAAFALVRAAVVAVSVGTAITINRVDPARAGDTSPTGGVFRGGAIAPGVRLALNALHHETGLLPRVAVNPGEAIPALGIETHAAIRSGVVRGLAGLVDRLVGEIGVGAAAVVVTGGDAPLLVPFLATRVQVEPDLALLGIALATRLRAGASA